MDAVNCLCLHSCKPHFFWWVIMTILWTVPAVRCLHPCNSCRTSAFWPTVGLGSEIHATAVRCDDWLYSSLRVEWSTCCTEYISTLPLSLCLHCQQMFMLLPHTDHFMQNRYGNKHKLTYSLKVFCAGLLSDNRHMSALFAVILNTCWYVNFERNIYNRESIQIQ